MSKSIMLTPNRDQCLPNQKPNHSQQTALENTIPAKKQHNITSTKDGGKIQSEHSRDNTKRCSDSRIKDSKYAGLAENYGVCTSKNSTVNSKFFSTERISENKFNSVRSIFEEKARTNSKSAGQSENKKPSV